MGVAEGRGVIGLEVAELLEEFADLYDDAEDVLVGGVVVHAEAFHLLVILDDWVETLLLKFLPVATQLVLVVGIEKQQEVLYV